MPYLLSKNVAVIYYVSSFIRGYENWVLIKGLREWEGETTLEVGKGREGSALARMRVCVSPLVLDEMI